MEFLMLGSLEVRVGGELIELRAPKHRALFASLLLRAPRSVSLDQLVDDIWGAAPPPSARHLIQVYVSDLRKALARAGVDDRLLTEGLGYRLRVESGEVDAQRFDELVTVGEGSLRSGDARAAGPALREALSLWRGPTLADTPLENDAAALRDALTEQRLAATELCLEAELAQGEAASLIPELELLVAAHPFRERLRAQLMLCLYRSGRQADALASFQEGRRLLMDELGIEPSRQLRDLERAILNQDEGLCEPSRTGDESGDGADAVGPAPSRRSRRAAVAVAAVVVAAAAATAAFLGTHDGTVGVAAAAGDAVAIDPASGRETAAVEIGPGAGAIATANGRLWIGARDAHTLSLVDLASRKVTRVVGLPSAPYEIGADGDVGWITYGFDGTIGRYDARTGIQVRPFHPLPGVRGLVALAVTPRDVWLGLADSVVLALDPVSSQVKQSVRLRGAVMAIAADPASVWAGTFPGADLVRIDPETARKVSVQPLVASAVDLAVDGQAAWALMPDRVVRVTVDGRAPGVSVPAGPGADHLAVGGGDVWVSSSGGVLEQIDATTGEIKRTLRLGHEIGGLVYAGGTLWVTVA